MGLRRDLEKNYCNYGKDKCMNRNFDIVNNSWHIFLKHSHTYAVISKEL